MPNASRVGSDMVKKKSVLIVDDHPLVREGLKVIIGRSSGSVCLLAVFYNVRPYLGQC